MVAVAPVIAPVFVPSVHAKLEGVLAVNAIPGPVPLHVDVLADVVTTGDGFTVTVIVYGLPIQVPAVEVGVTIYSTLPAVALLGFVNTWLIVLPDAALAPVILPVMVPIAQVKLLATLAFNAMLGATPLHAFWAAVVVITGVGVTITVIV